MNEKEYREVDALSYSMLSGLSSSPASLVKKRELTSQGVYFGSMVDTLLFDGQELFDENFCTLEAEIKVSDFVKSVVAKLVEINNPFGGDSFPPLDSCKDEIEKACEILKYGQSWTPATRLKKILEAKGYYEHLEKCLTRKVVDQESYEKAVDAVNTLSTHEFTRHYFDKTRKNVDIYFQVPILWKHNNHDCKSLLDVLIVDHNNQTWQAVDLKTTSASVYSFKESFAKWKYYLQASFYLDATAYAVKDNSAFQANEEINVPSHYKELPFEFVVIGSGNTRRPLVYKCSQNDLYCGKYGGKIGEIPIRGFDTLINEYDWHTDTMQYDYPKSIYDSNGIVYLNVFN